MGRFVVLLLVAIDSCAEAKGDFLANRSSTDGRLGSFLVIGDWGWCNDGNCGNDNIQSVTCQTDVSNLMEQTFSDLGDVKFVLNLGDSFYLSGVTSVDDSKWESVWRQKYSDALRSVPWYSVYGNHDYGGQDPCACRGTVSSDDQCVQTQYKSDGWHMPRMNYNEIHADLNLEVIALDTNIIDSGNIFRYVTNCDQTQVQATLQASANEAMTLLRTRLEDESGPSRVLIINHYPTSMWESFSTEMLDLIKNSKKDISVFGGHQHTMQTCEQAGSCGTLTEVLLPQRSYLVGGGGGYFDWQHDGVAKFGIMQGVVSSDGIKNDALTISEDQCKECVLPAAADAGPSVCQSSTLAALGGNITSKGQNMRPVFTSFILMAWGVVAYGK